MAATRRPPRGRRHRRAVVVDGDALLQRQPLGHLCDVDGDLAEQRQRRRHHRSIGGGLRRMDADLHAVLRGHQRRVGGDLVAVDDGGHLLRHGAQRIGGPLRHGLRLRGAGHLAHRGGDRPGLSLDQRAEVLVGVDDLAALVDGAVRHLQVRRERGRAEILRRDVPATHGVEHLRELLDEGALVGHEAGQCRAGVVGGGHDGASLVLGQGADQLGEQLLPQARDQPVEALAVHAGEQGDGHEDGDAVLGVAGLEAVLQVVVDGALAPLVGEGGLGDLLGVVAEQGRGVEVEQVRVGLAFLLPPRVEVPAGGDGGGQFRVVEVEEGVLVDDQATAAGLLLDLGGRLELLDVGVEERVVRGPVTLDEGVPDEHVPGGLRVDTVVGDHPVGDDGDAGEGGLLVGDAGGPLPGPGGSEYWC